MKNSGNRLLPTNLLLLPLFALGIFVGAFIDRQLGQGESSNGAMPIEVRAEGYRHIRPLVECEPPGGRKQAAELASFREEIKNKVDALTASGVAAHVSVYFRDLDNGPAFSIYPREDFVPASLMKVPILVGVLKYAEKNPGFLDYMVQLPPDFPSERGHSFSPEDELKPGCAYTILDLARRMIVFSDNNAVRALYQFSPEGTDRKTFADLGISLTSEEGRPDTISIESYASVFRVLYNASYLNRGMSELALSILAEAELPPGLNDLAPPGIPVAEKFGNIRVEGSDGTVQIHLCGIVYYPGRPYLVCIMTRGDDVINLRGALNIIGGEVYRQVDLRVPGDKKLPTI